ncbi:MAG: hypothetical protein IT431_07665 [Phycisphaerales bacterium]|nr:hypothetical protein [Phycisphaerales bacterium]
MGAPSKDRSGRARSWRGVAAMLAVALGLLLWARLKLVTDTPRMVYADPKARSASVDPGASPEASAGDVGAPPVDR